MMKYRWYELKLYSNFKDGVGETLNLLYRVNEFALFILRRRGITRILVMADDANSIHFFNIKNARIEELEWTPLLRYKYVNYYKSKRHYAIPIMQEVKPNVLYELLERFDDECLFVCYAKHTDKAYEISRWIMKKEQGDNLSIVLGLFNKNPRKRVSPFMQSIIEKARWKMRLKHFTTVIALASDNNDTLHMLESILPNELIVCKHFKDHNVTELNDMERYACILSDVELAGLIALPNDVSMLRLPAAGKVKTFTNGIVIDPIKDNMDLNLNIDLDLIQ